MKETKILAGMLAMLLAVSVTDFKYYMPISGDSWVISETGMGANEETADETARYLSEYIQDSGYTQDDFVIYALTGTDDTAYPALNRQIEAMKNYSESFTYSDAASEGNLFFQVAEGGVHNYTSMIQYIYNALPVFDRMMGTGADAANTATDLSRLVTAGTGEYRGFLMDNVLHSENEIKRWKQDSCSWFWRVFDSQWDDHPAQVYQSGADCWKY